jgi:hypothetical protein
MVVAGERVSLTKAPSTQVSLESFLVAIFVSLLLSSWDIPSVCLKHFLPSFVPLFFVFVSRLRIVSCHSFLSTDRGPRQKFFNSSHCVRRRLFEILNLIYPSITLCFILSLIRFGRIPQLHLSIRRSIGRSLSPKRFAIVTWPVRFLQVAIALTLVFGW